ISKYLGELAGKGIVLKEPLPNGRALYSISDAYLKSVSRAAGVLSDDSIPTFNGNTVIGAET
ncbi:MAG TPA: hypothetical protein VGK13_00620, partial [Methanocellaceae archaeon]